MPMPTAPVHSPSPPPTTARMSASHAASSASSAHAATSTAATAASPSRAAAGGASPQSAAGESSAPPPLRWSSSEMELSNSHRIMSAGIGAFLTSLVVTPFDVVKTRLQAQINSVSPTAAGAAGAPRRPTASQALLENCSHYRLHTGLTDHWCANCFSYSKRAPTSALSWQSTSGRPAPTPEQLRFNGALDAAAKLVRHEGLASLWRGLSPTLLMSIPSTVVYFSVYDKAKISLSQFTPEYLQQHAPEWAPYAGALQSVTPMLSGVFARALTTTLVSPIELVRTKSQALRTPSTMRALLSDEYARGGVRSLWRGVGPTLMRDVPFSAIYWTTYEYSKLWMLTRWGVRVDRSTFEQGNEGATQQDTRTRQVLPGYASATSASPFANQQHSFVYASFLAGAGSGMLSATITHPFDLIKTRRQIELYALHEPPSLTPASYADPHAQYAQPRSSAPSHAHASSSSSVASASPSLRHAASAASASASGSGSGCVLPSMTAPGTAPHLATPSTTWAVFRTIVAEEGYVGLLSGLSARITKIAPACAIMISCYEASKMFFGSKIREQADTDGESTRKRRMAYVE